MPEINIDTTSNRIQLGSVEFEAFFNRLIVLQDEYKSGYECAQCDTVGSIQCENCKGTGKSVVVKGGKCSACEGSGKQVCPSCKGKGMLLEIPQQSEHRPTCGTVVSIGEKVQHFKLGDKVIYPSHAGHGYGIGGVTPEGKEVKAFIVILRDDEILARMYGVLEQRAVKKSMQLHTVA